MNNIQIEERIRKNNIKIEQYELYKKKNIWIEFIIEMVGFLVLTTLGVWRCTYLNDLEILLGEMLILHGIGVLVLGIVRVSIFSKRKRNAPHVIESLKRENALLEEEKGKNKEDSNLRSENNQKSSDMVDCDVLIKYKTLLDSGVITQEEFETLKKKVLG